MTLLAMLLLQVDLPALEAKGVKLRKDKAGAVIELGAGGKVALTLEDYKAIGSLKTLKKLNLSSETTPFDDAAAEAVGNLDALEQFFSNGAKLTDEGFRGLAGWKSLQQFGLDHWFRAKKDVPIGAGLAHLAALPKLESIRLGGCMIGNDAMEALAKIKTLRKLDVFHTFAVTDEGMSHLKNLPELRILIAGPQYTPRITDDSLRRLAEVKTLEEIHLTETWLTWENGFRHLQALPNLKKLAIPKVVAEAADVDRLKAQLPALAVEWTSPDEATIEKTKAAFRRKK